MPKSLNTIEKVSHIEWTPLSEKDMIKKFKIDTDFRDPEKLENSVYEWQQKDLAGNPVIISMYRTLARYKRKFPESVQYSIEKLEEIMNKKWFTWYMTRIKQPRQNDLLWTLDLYDLHINKRDKYNTPINTKLKQYTQQVWILTERLKMMNVNKLAVILWWDVFETDHAGKTTKGTQVDYMIDEKDATAITQERTVNTIEWLRKKFATDIYFVLWNHDNNILFYFSKIIEALYSNTEVWVYTWQDRHYIERWETLLQLLHGDEKNALWILVNEYLMWSWKQFQHLYSKWWHTHRRELIMNWPLQVRTHVSPSKRNKRADKNWYDPKPAMEASVYSKKDWEIATFIANSK
jgi:hypothetical protein